MRTSLLLFVVIGFCIGVGARLLLSIPFTAAVLLLLFGFVFALLFKRSHGQAKSTLLISGICIAVATGIWRADMAATDHTISPLAAYVGQSVTFTGEISREPDYRERSLLLYVSVGDELVLVSTAPTEKLSYGDRIQVEGAFEQPVSFETELGKTFNYPGYLLAKGVQYRISFAEVVVTESSQGNKLIAGLLNLKQTLIAGIDRVIPDPASSLASGLLLGVQSSLGEELEMAFRKTGIVHIVVLSGYNVMLVVSFVMYFLSFLLPLRLRLVGGILAITAFALIVGLYATVVRASIMASMVLIAEGLGRRYSVLHALFIAGLMMLVVNPYLLPYDIGFQLSFMATLGLVLLVPQLEEAMVLGKSWYGLKPFFLATLATQIAVLPLLLFYIGEISLIAIIINMLVLPMVPVAMLLSFLAGVLSYFWLPLATMVGFVAYLSLEYILRIALWAAELPFAAVAIEQFGWFELFSLYALITLLWWKYVQGQNKGETDLSGWVIEGETAALEQVGSKAAETKQLPIFFR